MHVAITDVTDSRSHLAPIKLCGSSGIDFTRGTAGTNAVKLTRHDVCHLRMFSSMYVNASSMHLVAFNVRRSF